MSAEVAAALFLKFMGAAAGAALALVFVPPKTRQGFVRRLTAALIFGTVFANYVRGYLGFDQDQEGLIAAACLTGFVSWWLMGAIKRAADAWQGPKAGQEGD